MVTGTCDPGHAGHGPLASHRDECGTQASLSVSSEIKMELTGKTPFLSAVRALGLPEACVPMWSCLSALGIELRRRRE